MSPATARFAARAARIAKIRHFLHEAGFGQATRLRIQGDASTRSYERLTLDGESYILMNSPKRPDGPPVRDGKPYSQIAHLAEDVTPFIAMAKGLRLLGLSAPAIYAADREAGLLVLEDLGNELVVEGDPPAPIEARYEVATDLLAALHRERTHDTISVEPGVQYHLPRYDMDAMLIETELLLDWFLPLLGHTPSDAACERLSHALASSLDAGLAGAADLGAARLSFAQSIVAAAPRWHRAHWPARLPGCDDGLRALTISPRCCRMRASTCRS